MIYFLFCFLLLLPAGGFPDLFSAVAGATTAVPLTTSRVAVKIFFSPMRTNKAFFLSLNCSS